VDTSAAERAAELARQLAALEAQQRASAAAVASKLTVIQQRVAGPGVLAQRGQSVVRVVFTDAVFTAGTDLSPAGLSALTALGKRLPGLKATITVTGYSVVVPGGTSSGGSRTALLRARVATQELSTASCLPLTMFTMQSGDQAHPPYRDNTKNRTVTVTLTPVTGR
jgi:type VI secretion system protein ImpK